MVNTWDFGPHIMSSSLISSAYAVIAQMVEHFLGKEEVVGSNPINSLNLAA